MQSSLQMFWKKLWGMVQYIPQIIIRGRVALSASIYKPWTLFIKASENRFFGIVIEEIIFCKRLEQITLILSAKFNQWYKSECIFYNQV